MIYLPLGGRENVMSPQKEHKGRVVLVLEATADAGTTLFFFFPLVTGSLYCVKRSSITIAVNVYSHSVPRSHAAAMFRFTNTWERYIFVSLFF